MGMLARALDLSEDSPEHRRIRDDAAICGAFMVARYYLTVLTGTSFDLDDVPERMFLAALRDFLAKNIGPEAVEFCLECEGEGMVSFAVLPTLRKLFHEHTGLECPRKPTKQERALVMLLKNPCQPDSRIRDALRTTDNQMKRWSDFNVARRIQKRYHAGDR